ncbi:hypothetical protein BDW62DRAFT_214558 [Aspergillus aurantiobrunneus]
MHPESPLQLSPNPSSIQIIRELIYHDNGDPGYTENGRDLNRFRCELNAYEKLLSFGVCERQIVPYFHGYIDRMDPAAFHPALRSFYLPNAESLNCVNYSESLFPQAIEGRKEIHQACVAHEDIYPNFGEHLKQDQKDGLPPNTKYY